MHGNQRRSGFTLTEILIVIAIIAILTSLVILGIGPAMDKARNAKISTDLTILANELTEYKTQHSDYPPAMFGVLADRVRFNRHVRQRFPRYNAALKINNNNTSRDPYDHFARRAQTFGLNVANLDAAESIVLWLGGFSDKSGMIASDPASQTKMPGAFVAGQGKLIPFSGVQSDPFTAHNPNDDNNMGLYLPTLVQPGQPTFEFLPNRLVDRDNDGWLEYAIDIQADSGPMPGYAYFDAKSYLIDHDNDNNTQVVIPTYILNNDPLTYGIGVPYVSSAFNINSPKITDFIKPKEFQLICCGLDGNFGTTPPAIATVRAYPYGTNYSGPDEDNLTNFSTSPLGSDIPQ